jgi:hypothetical protein
MEWVGDCGGYDQGIWILSEGSFDKGLRRRRAGESVNGK